MPLQHLGWMAGLMMASFTLPSFAQPYPARAVSLVVAFPPGAATDAFARVAAAHMSEQFGRQILVVNRDGASGIVGTDFVAKARPDGYTLLWQSSSLTISAASGTKLPYDPIGDFSPVGTFAQIPFVLVVHPSLPVKNVSGLVALARTRRGELNYGSAGPLGFNHMAAELLKLKTKIDIVHVPYRGTALLTTDLLGGQVHMAFTGPTTALPHMKTARLRALATTGAERSPTFAQIPTMSEAGVPGYEFSQWYGMLAPLKTPREIVEVLNKALIKSLDDPTVKQRMAAEAGVPFPTTPDAFAGFMKEDLANKVSLIRAAGIK